jgi:hypothetical protein
LWRSVLSAYELEEHERQLLREMCRTVDQLDQLHDLVEREGVMDPRWSKPHPALVESRQLRIAYARLSGALRLPAGDESDPAASRRPQRRVGVRSPYRMGIRGVVA